MINQTIHKHRLTNDVTRLALPEHAKILSVHNQGEEPTLWVLLDPSLPRTQVRTFLLIGTGWPETDFTNREFIGTVLLCNGSLVFHVFELKTKEQ